MKKRPRAYSLLFVLFALALAAGLTAACSDEEGSGDEERNAAPAQAAAQVPDDEPVAQVAAEVSPSVVQVNIQAIQTTPFGTQERKQGVGSGVIYRENGYIVTNHHVVEGASEVNVAFADGTTERAEVVGSDSRSEIAVVRVDRDNLPAATFSENQDVVVGQLAVAIGSPSGFESTVTAGVVSAIGREFPPELTGGDPEATAALADLVQTDAAISPGSSGGALADRDGEIIGINVAYLPPQQTGAVNLGFAIPSDTAASVADQLIETGEVSSAYLGVVTTDLSTEEAERFDLAVESGALVMEVESGSAAGEAGVRSGDVIVALGDDPIESTGDLLGALRDYQPGDAAELTIIRDGEEQTVDVTLNERPSQ